VRKDFERTVRRIVKILGRENCVLIGGLAVGAHGYVRGTKDVDFIARIPLQEVQRLLREHGIASQLLRGNPLDGDFSCVKLELEDVRVDILPPLVPIEWDRAVELPVTKTEAIRVVPVDALIQLKLRAQGPKDLMDAAALVLRHPELRKRAEELAAARGVLDRLTSWLEDKRLKAEISETRPKKKSESLRDSVPKALSKGRGGPGGRSR
jgi:hypothetical protein